MARLDVNWIDYGILAAYFVVVLGVGFAARRYIKTSLDYFLSGRSLPPGMPGPALLSAPVDHRARVHLGQPRPHRGARHGRQRGAVRLRHVQLLLDRRDPGHGVPRPGDDALLLRGQGPLGAGVPAVAVLGLLALLQLGDVRAGHRADRGREPVRARAG